MLRQADGTPRSGFARDLESAADLPDQPHDQPDAGRAPGFGLFDVEPAAASDTDSWTSSPASRRSILIAAFRPSVPCLTALVSSSFRISASGRAMSLLSLPRTGAISMVTSLSKLCRALSQTAARKSAASKLCGEPGP